MWEEGASDLWGHLESEETARLGALRKRLRKEASQDLGKETEDPPLGGLALSPFILLDHLTIDGEEAVEQNGRYEVVTKEGL